VADGDEHVRLALGTQHELQRLHRVTTGLRGMKRGSAARVEDACALRQTPVDRHSAEPVGLREESRAGEVAVHGGVYTMPPVDGYPFVYRDTVRFRDLDGMGHVNNAVFFTYMESARIAYLASLGAGSNPQQSLILARAEADFRSPIAFGEEIEVGVRTSRMGSKSFDLEYEVRADGRVAAEGRSVLVGYDYARGASVEIPAEWREWLAPEVTV
jgi:acyl-CoA thioester hydrolase